jgi:hypothetical protein
MAENHTVTTYGLGAGASAHAGYPLCVELWPRMLTWVLQETSDSEFRTIMASILKRNTKTSSTSYVALLEIGPRGGKRHEVPAHHKEEEYLDAYIG